MPQAAALDVIQAAHEEAEARFSLTAYDEPEGDVQIITTTPSKPNIRRPASLSLLYGLAILSLDHDGTIERRMNELLDAGPINEVDACNRIAQFTTA
ncbi:hypothetical protein CcrColossus_gp147 [Caulobacter phage CcrColossus]|uniref:Uncharacterized protein n=1 Tax=Caulobacter phage CcrColossus TaxID=1211640 RepID=K4K681_9CAUD|nr:hypothetical protein CcrColossus_gp147 [Caulobacter phage CcrColossus]AFU88017.1 hypothetical protein CcrColossus_gp147 [Caulobacter phage CcrColossus]